jgi:hypothetical protein
MQDIRLGKIAPIEALRMMIIVLIDIREAMTAEELRKKKRRKKGGTGGSEEHS